MSAACARCGQPIHGREAYTFIDGSRVTEFCEKCFSCDLDACYDTHVELVQKDLRGQGLLPW